MLYIISHGKYKSYLEASNYRYLFPIYTPILKPKILEDISIGEEIKGKIVGVNLREIDYKDKNMLKKFINKINSLKEDGYKNIYIEELIGENWDIKTTIENETGLKFPNKINLKVHNIKLILHEILKYKESLREAEVLIICNDEELIIRIIKLLHKEFLFISIFENSGCGDSIYENILKDIGISIFRQKNRESIKEYGIIINMEKDVYIDINNINKEAIVFDFSESYKFRDIKNNILIEDISINSIENNKLLSKEIISSLYEELYENHKECFYRIYSRGKLYRLDELLNHNSKLKGSI